MTNPKRQKVKIIYGAFGGERIGRRMRAALRAAGYKVVHSTHKADIIMAHSAGCFWLPEGGRQKIMLVDPPYWPGRSVRERIKARMRSNADYRTYGVTRKQWLSRNLWGMYYAITNIPRTVRLFRHMPVYDLQAVIKDRKVTLVRNEYDDWLTPDLADLKRANPGLTVVELPGEHDDFNYNPKRYVDLLQSL